MATTGLLGQKEATLSIPINDVRNHFSDTLNRVIYRGEKIELTRRGEVIAVIVPPEDSFLPLVTINMSSIGGRDNLADAVNHAHYGGKVIGIKRRDIIIAVIMSPATFMEIRAGMEIKGPSTGLDDLIREQEEQRGLRPKSGRRVSRRLPEP